MTIEQLQTENSQLKAINEGLEYVINDYQTDLKAIKNVLLQMVIMVGMVNADGSINEKVKVKHIMSEVTSIAFTAMSPFADKSELEQKFSFLKEILPIYEKYKNL